MLLQRLLGCYFVAWRGKQYTTTFLPRLKQGSLGFGAHKQAHHKHRRCNQKKEKLHLALRERFLWLRFKKQAGVCIFADWLLVLFTKPFFWGLASLKKATTVTTVTAPVKLASSRVVAPVRIQPFTSFGLSLRRFCKQLT